MKYCVNCLQPDTRPNSVFSKDGKCPACIYFEKTINIDWAERIRILKQIILNIKKKPGQIHDCIIGVSGGKDSTRQALFLRDKFNLNPLLVCLSYPPDQLTDRGANNLSNLIELGFDVLVSSPAPKVWKKLKKVGFDKFTNSFRSTEAALFASVPQIAIKYGINLIFWGENPALQVGDLKTLGRNGYDGNNLRNLNTLSSGYIWMLKAIKDQKKIIPYIYPSEKEFKKNNIQIIYLGWFIGDWTNVNNAKYSVLNGVQLRKEKVEKTGDLYGISALDEDFSPINLLIRYYKYGFGRVSDFLNEEIRNKKIKRRDAIKIVEKYDASFSKQFLNKYCKYLNISTEYFWKKIHKSLNKKIFKIENNKIKRKFKVGSGI